jgi:YtkA-like/AcrB/AcrD/AcrF family
MTVSTVVAGLLPIMWSTSVGAEVMKPLATPVLGGMVSSLVHVLIVTPVIFFWLQARRLGLALEAEPEPRGASSVPGWRRGRVFVALLVLAGAALALWLVTRPGGVEPGGSTDETGTIVQRARAGELEVVVMSPGGTLKQGRNVFTLEFRSSGGQLVDVGAVHASATMTMPGMVMSGAMQIAGTGVPGRYQATAEFGMAGAWPIAIEWNGPAGRGSVSFEGMVQ